MPAALVAYTYERITSTKTMMTLFYSVNHAQKPASNQITKLG